LHVELAISHVSMESTGIIDKEISAHHTRFHIRENLV